MTVARSNPLQLLLLLLLLLLLVQVRRGSKRECLFSNRLLLPREPGGVLRRVLWRLRRRGGIGSIGTMTIAITSHAGRRRTRSDAGQESLDIIGSGHFCSLWPESKLTQRRREGGSLTRQLDAQRSALFRELKMREGKATVAGELKDNENEQNRKRTEYSTVETVERQKGEKRREEETKVEVSERKRGANPDRGVAVRGWWVWLGTCRQAFGSKTTAGQR